MGKKIRIFPTNNMVTHINSVIHWNSIKLEMIGGRNRQVVKVTCGKCGQDRWLSADNLFKNCKKESFTGACQSCCYSLTWKEKHRLRPARRKLNDAGYIKVFIGTAHPWADKCGEIFEHRLVMAQSLGRELLRHEHVHHKNGIRSDNRLENLELLPGKMHGCIKDLQTRIKVLETLLIEHGIPIPA